MPSPPGATRTRLPCSTMRLSSKQCLAQFRLRAGYANRPERTEEIQCRFRHPVLRSTALLDPRNVFEMLREMQPESHPLLLLENKKALRQLSEFQQPIFR